MTIIEGSAAVAVGIDAAVVANHYIVVRRPDAGQPGPWSEMRTMSGRGR
jgi:hypothetical protein